MIDTQFVQAIEPVFQARDPLATVVIGAIARWCMGIRPDTSTVGRCCPVSARHELEVEEDRVRLPAGW